MVVFFSRYMFACVVWMLAGFPLPAVGSEPTVPNFWDTQERITAPRVTAVERVRFLTTIDFPPLNFMDPSGKLSGFHIDLAKAICQELKILDRCTIQALPWAELESALARGEGDAIIAGLAISAARREQFSFSRPYLKFPARFIVPVELAVEEPLYARLENRRIGVIANSLHEAMLRDYFPQVRVVTFDDPEWMYNDLKSGKLTGVFGDGMRLSFWLGSGASGNCCKFAGGPYLSDRYLGSGLAIAVHRDRHTLTEAFDYALRNLNSSEKFSEIYLRYFPRSFF